MNRSGFSTIIVFVVAVVLLALGAGIWYQARQNKTPESPQSQELPPSPSSTAPITSESHNYPIKYPVVDPYSLKKSFIERNGNQWSVSFDRYGFIKEAYTSDSSLVPQDKKTQYILTDAEKTQWEKFIIKNADFFGIDDPSSFKLEPFSFGAERRLEAAQKPSNYSFVGGFEGELPLEVFKNVATIPKFKVTVDIQQHFWPNAALPPEPSLSPESIKRQFIGKYFESQSTTRLNNSNIKVEGPFAHFLTLPNNGELRLVYELGLPGASNLFFIDAVTGEQVDVGLYGISLQSKLAATDPLYKCFPLNLSPQDVVSTDLGGKNKITVEDKLKELGAYCDSGGALRDSSGKEINFYNVTGCWGNPPYDYQKILSEQQAAIDALKTQGYTIVEMTCNPSGAMVM